MDERPGGGHVHLTPAEREVMPLLARGMSDEEMAREVGISILAVRSRLHDLYDKAGVSGRKAVVFAREHLACCIGVGAE